MIQKNKGKSNFAPLKRLLPYIGESKWWLMVGIFSMLLIAVMTVGFGTAIQYIIEGVPEDDLAAEYYFNNTLMIVLGIICVYGVASFSRMFSMRMVCIYITRSLRNDIFSKIMGLGTIYVDRHSSGNLQTRIIADTASLGELFSKEIPLFFKSSMMFTAALSACYYVNPKLAAIVTIGVPVIVLPFMSLAGKLRNLGKQVRGAIAETGRFAGEAFRNIKVVQAFSRQNIETEQFEEKVETTRQYEVKVGRLTMGVNASVESISFICFAVLFWFASRDIIAGTMTIGELVSFGFYVQAIVIAAKNLVTVGASMNLAVGYAEKVVAYLDEDNPLYVPQKPKTLPEKISAGIEFKEVQFSYPSRPDKIILKGVNLQIPAYSRLAIVGQSGAGKSTLLELLLRIYDVNEGEIAIDGENLREVEPSKISEKMGYIPQQPFLISGTIGDNIRFGDQEASDEEVIEAARKAHIHEFIETLPKQYNTDIGEVGSRLSGGQKQRISLARSFVKKPEILLLDEATSALDKESERFIEQALKEVQSEQVTMISVTHSIQAAQQADKIAVMHDGQIMALGTHDELLATSDYYQRLCHQESETNEAVPA